LTTNAQSGRTKAKLVAAVSVQAPLDLFENFLTPPTRNTHHARRAAQRHATAEFRWDREFADSPLEQRRFELSVPR
jgi:hypothetical protein